MQDQIRKQILDAFFVALRPIAKILLRYGIGFREFAEVSKAAFVDVATSEYGIRGRPTNISRVAVMTGLTRKEVRRLRDQLAEGSKSLTLKSTPLAKVIHKWHSDEEYLDASGRAATLPFAGESRSFSNLVKRFGGDIPPGAMRTELKRVGAIEEDADGNVVPIRRDIIPDTEHQNLCVALVHGAYPLLSTIAHNTDPDVSDATWAQLTSFTSDIGRSDIKRLRRICDDRTRQAAESFDDLFMAYEKLNEDEIVAEPRTPVAVGLFYFEERNEDSMSVWSNK